MKCLLPVKRCAGALLIGGALLLGTPAFAQAPAELAPADTGFFMHINEPADWFGDLTEGPLGDKFRDKIETAEVSGDILAALGMDTNEFMDAYFGGDVVVLGKSAGDDSTGVIFSKVAQDQRDHAVDSLGLKRNGEINGNPVYVGPDGDGYVVFMQDWVAMCDLKDVAYLKSILNQNANAPRLADTERYAKWTKELPGDRSMTMLAFESEDSEHAMGVVRKGKGLDLTYLGTSPDFDELMGMLGETSVAEFGPLPADTISAVSVNLLANDEMRKNMAGLDMFFRGKSFTDDIAPKLDAPTLMFMAAVDGADVDPKLDVDIPVVGMAFKMKDDSVATDLAGAMDMLVLMGNLAVAEFQAGPIPQRTATYNDASFKVAEIGKPVAQGLEFPELAPIQIVYGQIGDYYVICTQEVFFKRCVDANAAGRNMRIEIEGPTHRLAKTPVMAMTARPDGFGALLLSWANMLEEKGLPDAIDQGVNSPVDTEMLFNVIDLMQQYSRMKVQVWSGEDDLVIGRAQLTPPQ